MQNTFLVTAPGPQPADHERDNAQEEPCPRRTRVDEAGEAVPESRDSITRGSQGLQLGDIPAVQADQVNRAPRPTQQRSRHQRAFLLCAQCGADPQAHVGNTDNGHDSAQSTEVSHWYRKV